MRTLLSILLLISGTFVTVLPGTEVPFNGKTGAGLRSAIAESGRLTRVARKGELSGSVYDPFDGRTVNVVSGVLPDGYTWGELVPAAWWEDSGMYGDTVGCDLYNLFPLNRDVVAFRRDLVPGWVEDVVFANGRWSAGYSEVVPVGAVEYYMPPEEFRGHLARVFFDMAVMYPARVWSARGFMMMTGEAYPGLNEYARGLLMEWHEAFPVSDVERTKNDVVATLQGNRNPFVDYPDLASYLWGEKAGEAFVVEGERVPLHGVYRLSDAWIDLVSPDVPQDAVWSVDGVVSQSDRYKPSELGLGWHELAYECDGGNEKGYLRIRVVE